MLVRRRRRSVARRGTCRGGGRGGRGGGGGGDEQLALDSTRRRRRRVVQLAAAERVTQQVWTVEQHRLESTLRHADHVQRQQRVQLYTVDQSASISVSQNDQNDRSFIITTNMRRVLHLNLSTDQFECYSACFFVITNERLF